MCGNGTFSPIYVNTGDIITANVYNYIVDIFAYSLGYNTGIHYVYKNQALKASYINALRDTINTLIDIREYNSQPIPVEPDIGR